MEPTNNKKTLSFVGIALLTVLAVMIYFVVKEQTLVFEDIKESNHVMLSVSEKQSELTRNYASLYHQTTEALASVTQELDSTKILLQQSQDILAQTKKENSDLQEQLAALTNQADPDALGLATDQLSFNKSKKELEQQIALLNEKNNQFAQELSQIKEQLRSFEGDIKNINEGKALISLFHNRLKLVKTKMIFLKREALFARVAAQKEHDRMLFLKGNQGYLVKGGMPTQEGPKAETTPQGEKNVNIDVSFVE